MKNNFLKWWLLNATVFVCFAIASYFGLLKEIYLKDSSFLTFVIILLYIANSVYNGFLSWNVDKRAVLEEGDTDTGWFISEICLSLGMIGTVIGFIQMLSGFAKPVEGVQALQTLLSNMSYGMATALYTTLGGLICGNLLKFQCFMLGKNLESNKEKKCPKTETMDRIQAS